jgi:hypothetical protein
MDSVVFHLERQELDQQFLKRLKSLFKGHRLTITVTPEPKEITNPELLATLAHNEQSDISYTMSADEFDKIADTFLANNDFDVVSAIKAHKNP